MEILISIFAVLVAFSCLYFLVSSDVRDKRKTQLARIKQPTESQQTRKH
jgi:hypothetical protein